MTDRRLGWLTLLAASALVLAVQVAQPVGVPLYDGVVIQEPYRFLHPTGDQAGSPGSYSGEAAVTGDGSPSFAAFTSENPPQAQFSSRRRAFPWPRGAPRGSASVRPVEPRPRPAAGRIAGNVYRFAVTDQAGTPLEVRTCAGCLTVRMRAPEDTTEAVLQRYADGAWQDVQTTHEGMTGTYVTDVLALGDYAVISAAAVEPGGPGAIVVLGGAAVILLLAFGAFLLLRVRQAPPTPEPAPRARIPSKRKGRR